jgi:hypothetical protein
MTRDLISRTTLHLDPKAESLQNYLKAILDRLQRQITGLLGVANKASERHAADIARRQSTLRWQLMPPSRFARPCWSLLKISDRQEQNVRHE